MKVDICILQSSNVNTASFYLVQCMNGVKPPRIEVLISVEAVHGLFTADAVSRCVLEPGQYSQSPRFWNGRKHEIRNDGNLLIGHSLLFSGWVTKSPMLCLCWEDQELVKEPNVPG